MMMSFRATSIDKCFLHTSQQYGRSPVCTLWCISRLLLSLNLLLHTSQQYGCHPVCKWWCLFRLLLLINVFCTYHSNMDALQYVHVDVHSDVPVAWMFYDTYHRDERSPVCTRIWTFKVPLEINVLLHTSQQYGRSPVCTLWCISRLFLSLNVLLHTSQQYGRSPVCKLRCLFRILLLLNVLLHTSQQYGCSPVCK